MEILNDLTTITWVLIGAMLVAILYFHGPSFSVQTVRTAPSILTSFGIFGTFLGIAFGLMQFDSANIEASVPIMIDGLGVAVWSSIVGILTRLADDYNLLKIRPSGDISVVEHGFVVCKQCLHTLRYKNYDEYRNRRRGYSQKVLSEFSLQEFFKLYQQYPLSFRAKRES